MELSSYKNGKALEDRIGYSFNDKLLLKEALSHSSYINELKMNKTACYERLEFLGDAILEHVTSAFLFESCPDSTEGQLSKHRAALVCEKALSACAREIGLGEFILLGKGERKNNGQEKDSILCDVMEAIIGAIYKDSGFEDASAFIYRLILKGDDTSHYIDFKTQLQELVQSMCSDSISYEVENCSGPDHNKVYSVRVLVGCEVMGHGVATNKKEAERLAASEAIIKINNRG